MKLMNWRAILVHRNQLNTPNLKMLSLVSIQSNRIKIHLDEMQITMYKRVIKTSVLPHIKMIIFSCIVSMNIIYDNVARK